MADALQANSRDIKKTDSWFTRLKNTDTRTLERVLFWLFASSILLFPLGQMFRTGMPDVCLPILLWLYVRDWPNRALAHLPVWKLLAIFFAVIALEVIGSHWFSVSWNAVRPNIFRGFLLPFIGMECIRSEQDLRRLIGMCCLTCIIEGLDGLWQFAFGLDLIDNRPPLPLSGEFIPGDFRTLLNVRLTGSMGTYRCGNYLALIGLPACGLVLLWPIKNAWLRCGLTFCLLSPTIFLFLGTQTRAGFMAVTAGLYLIWLLLTRPAWWKILLPPLAGIALVLYGPHRIALSNILHDGRVLIWKRAWQCIQAHFWLGTGADTYEPACKALGITQNVPPHPHNIYIQWLVDGGICGFLIMSVCLFGLTGWALLGIRQGLRNNPPESAGHRFWELTTFFWASWAGYLIAGLVGHSFYRTWWVSVSFSILGIVLGACVCGKRIHSGCSLCSSQLQPCAQTRTTTTKTCSSCKCR